MTTAPGTTRRPGGITVIVALAVIDAVFTIIGGIWVVLDHDQHELLARSGFTSNGLLSTGVAAIVLGFIGLMVALALGRGSRIARLLFGIWAVLSLANGLYHLVALGGEQQLSGAVQSAVAIIVLYLLYGSEEDREFFLR